MDAVTPIEKFNTAKRMQQRLRKDPNDIEALLQLAALLGTLKKPDLEQKRKILQRVLSLEPANSQARQMLFEMDRAAIGGDPSRLSAAVMLTPKPVDELTEKPLRLIYSLLHQLLFYPILAFSIALLFKSAGEWDVFGVFMGFFLLLLIPLWFLSAILEVNNSGLNLSRLFGIYRREMEWKEIERVEPGPMGVGMKLVANDGGVLMISSQLHGYSSLVEILRNARPDLFEGPAMRVFQKGFLAKYGLFFFLIPATPLAIGGIFVPPFIFGILFTMGIFLLWRSALLNVYLLRVNEDRLSIRSFTMSREFTVPQIRKIEMVTVRRYRKVAKNYVRIESHDGGWFTVFGFPEGNEMLYGFLKNWWNAYQTP